MIQHRCSGWTGTREIRFGNGLRRRANRPAGQSCRPGGNAGHSATQPVIKAPGEKCKIERT